MILFDITTITTYCIAAIALVIAPGPGQALVLAALGLRLAFAGRR